MSLRKLAVFCGLLSVIVTSSPAWSQSPPRRTTFAERISAFGRGITGSSVEEQPATPTATTETPATRSSFPQVDGRSLLPNNMFGSKSQPQPQQAPHPTTERAGAAPRAGNQSNTVTHSPTPTTRTNTANPSTSGPSTTDRYATRPRTGSTSETTSSASGASLPGLGGSPLPPAAKNESTSSSNESDDITPSMEPVSNDNFRGTSAPSSRPSPSTTTSSEPSTRQSPQRRAPMHVDTSELRHELAGSYPTNDTSETTPLPTTDTSNKASATDSAVPAASPDAVFTLPTADGGPAFKASPTIIPEAVPVVPNVFPTREDAAPATMPAVEPITRPQTSGGFAPATTPLPANQSLSTQPLPASPQPARRTTTPAKPLALSALTEPNVLVANRTPVITSDIRGPKQILVGREATFRVRLQNQGDAPAEGVDVALRVPSWADVVDTSATAGTVVQPPGESKGVLKWQLARLEARGSETVDIRLIPRTSRPLELGVTWTLAPVGSRAVVEVQEPKIEMNVAGPDEVLFGKPQLYRFTISNPGSGVAEGVKIELYPPGGGEKPAASNPLADLQPGKSQTIEVELVAREAGKLKIRAVASAAGDLTSESIKEVFCRKSELAIDWRGPEMKYAGTEATYFIRVRNPGTAAAEDVTVRATLPEGAQLTSASEGQVFDAARREIAWRVGSLGPGDDSYMELKCTVNTPGTNQLKLEASNAAGDLSDKKLAETKVVALGDLKLDVSDPSGPVAVGDAAVYEIRVQNRGASSAKEVNIVGLFSAGVEPDQGDGTQYTVSNGRVSFRTIDELPAGRQVSLKIRAHAVQPGTHVFRAEVLCRELEIKLAAEETTRFYADDTRDSHERQAAGNTNGFETTR